MSIIYKSAIKQTAREKGPNVIWKIFGVELQNNIQF